MTVNLLGSLMHADGYSIFKGKLMQFTKRARLFGVRLIVLTLAGLIFASPSSAADYAITDLGTLGGPNSEAFAINNNGDVLGRAEISVSEYHAVLWRNGTMTDLRVVGNIFDAWAINDNGQIAGNSAVNQKQPVIWSNGAVTVLPVIPISGHIVSYANGINNSGQVVGENIWFGDDQGFLWSNGTMTNLGAFVPFAINNYGEFVGWDFPGANSVGLSINDFGQVTGSFNLSDGISFHAFLRSGGITTDLNTLGGMNSVGKSINNKGQIVGYSSRADGSISPFLWSNGTMTDLNSLITDSGWTLVPGSKLEKIAINDNGQIAATGIKNGERHALLLTPVNSCSVQVTREGQGDLPWGPKPYDTRPGRTISQLGCALTALSMALNFVGVTNDPLTLNDFMIGSDADYLGGFVNWGPATHDASDPSNAASPFPKPKQMRFDNLGGAKYSRNDSILSPTGAFKQVNDALCAADPHPVIVGVSGIRDCATTGGLPSPDTPGHFVLVTGKQVDANGIPHYSIIDPGCQTNTSLDVFNNEFVTRGVVKDPPGDISELDIAVDGNADLLVADPFGNVTGHDVNLGTISQSIAGSSYISDALNDDVTGEPGTDVTRQVPIFQPSVGTFRINVNGTKLASYTLSVRAFSQDGSAQPFIVLKGIGAPGSTTQYQVQFVSAPGSVSSATVFATFEGTLSDITNSLQLGLIDNSGTANSLSQKISAAQKQTGSARTNILNAFTQEVNAQAGKHLNGLVVDVLLQDAASLISQNGN